MRKTEIWKYNMQIMLTSCAARKAPRSKRPGSSTKDQLLDPVTNMSA